MVIPVLPLQRPDDFKSLRKIPYSLQNAPHLKDIGSKEENMFLQPVWGARITHGSLWNLKASFSYFP